MRTYFKVSLLLAVVYCQLDSTRCEDQLNNNTLQENCAERFSYRCKNSTCISEGLLCDGRPDCQDADDEDGCIKREVKTVLRTDQIACAKMPTNQKSSERCYCREEISESGGTYSVNCVDTELASFPTLIQDFSLVKIYFTGNKLTKLSMRTFREAWNLRDILLPHNEINTIENNTFAELGILHEIKNLDLSDNHITKLAPEMFRSLGQTSFLSLARNQILDIENDTFAKLTINNIDLSGNKLSKLTAGMFSGSHGIKQLNLQDNEIVAIETHAFRNLGNLEDLNISGNRIMNLIVGIFEGWSRLSVLDLSRNYLTKLNARIFPKWLKELLLSSENNISLIEPTTFQTLEYLEYLNLSGNPLHDVHPELFRFNPRIILLSVDDISVCCTTQQIRPCKWKGNGTCEQPRPEPEDWYSANSTVALVACIVVVFIIIVAVSAYIFKKKQIERITTTATDYNLISLADH